MPFFLKRKEILRKNKDIKAIFANDNKIVGKFVLIYFNQGTSRKVAFMVSKKLIKEQLLEIKSKGGLGKYTDKENSSWTIILNY